MAATGEPTRRSLLRSFGLERLGLLALDFPVLSAVLAAIVTALAAWGIAHMRVDDSLSELFRTNTKEFRQYQEIDRRFPSSEYDVLVVVEGPDLLKKPQLEAFRNVAVELQLTDGVGGIVSMMSARGTPDETGYAPPVVPDDLPAAGPEYDGVIGALQANDIVKGKFLSDDGTLALIVISLDRELVQEQGAKAVIGGIKDAVDEQLKGSGLKAKLTGAPVMQLEIRNAVERDRLVYNGLGLLFGGAIALFFFRRLSLMAVAALPPLFAVIMSLGLLGWLGFKLNLFLNVMTPLVMVMGFSDSMQMTAAIRDRLRHGDSKWEATRFACRVVGPACVLAHGTALTAFTALLFSGSGLIQTFGQAGALSTIVSFVAVLGVLPVLAVGVIRGEESLSLERAPADGAMDWLGGVVGGIVDEVVARPWMYTLVGLGLLSLFSYLHFTLEPRYRLADQVPDREQALQATAQLDQKLTGANPVHVMITWQGDGSTEGSCKKAGAGSAAAPQGAGEGTPGAADGAAPAVAPSPAPVASTARATGISLYDVGTLGVISRAHDVLEKQAGLGNVWSLESLRRWLDAAGDASIETVKRYVCILPEHLVRRFIAEDETAVLVTARLPDVDSSELLPKIELIDAALDPVRAEHPGYEIAVTGLPAIAARNSASMITHLNYSLPIAVVFVSALIGLAFRSMFVFGLTLLPGLFPIVATGSLLAVMGYGLEFASVVALIVVFGLGIDGLIHFLNRLRREERPGEDPALAIRRARVLVGPAIILTTIVLAFGLGVTVFSDLPSLRLFGGVCAVTLMASLVADLVFLPAMIAVYRRYFKVRE